MSLVSCVACGAHISDDVSRCPKCGSNQPKSRNGIWIVAGVLGALVTLALMAGNTPEAQARSAQRRVIEHCWNDQKRAVHAPAGARFVAGVCEKLEADFVKQHGMRP